MNLTKRTYEELLALNERTGKGKTDIVNRALQISSFVEDLLDKGNGHLTVIHQDGQREQIYIM